MSLKPKSSLNHLSSSPIRGQLEPYDASSPEGWRWLQTTDTVDQFKVLLPPETSRMYAEILRQERLELGQATSVNWSRVLEIRHLKDRMIRKTQRLSNAREVRRIGIDQFKFQSVVAPVDFRLKEMERWLRLNRIQPSGGERDRERERERETRKRESGTVPVVMKVYQASTSHSPLRHRSSTATCARCSRAASSSSRSRVPSTHNHRPSSRTSRLHIHDEIEEEYEEVEPHPAEVVAAATSYFPRTSTPPLNLRNTDSPDPLPVKIREHIPASLSSTPPLPEHVAPPTLTRRRSSLKRRGSADAAKTVSWADADGEGSNQVDVTKYSVLAQEAFESGNKWDEARKTYETQLSSLDALHMQIEQELLRLRLESQRLQQLDEDIIVQKATVTKAFQGMEQTQAVFLAKVNQVLDDAHGSSPKPDAGTPMPDTIEEEASVVASETREEEDEEEEEEEEEDHFLLQGN